ncbi:hypothetical protein M0R72_17855 [Candidatus Pacearchaeota archaeon]|jgi:hypothetical protein|nr:hypothetical protein [Candidatus Pacearchaeota archaeon]
MDWRDVLKLIGKKEPLIARVRTIDKQGRMHWGVDYGRKRGFAIFFELTEDELKQLEERLGGKN